MNFKEEIFKSIQTMVNMAVANCKVDRTYKSIVKKIVKKGYVVLDDAGNERIVKCCLPGVELKVGEKVWLKVPMGDLKEMHICGVV